jgi:hypothetical protein
MFAVVYGNVRAESAVGKAGLFLAALGVIALAALYRRPIIIFTWRAAKRLRIPHGIAVCLAAGLAARFAWGLGFAGTMQSDSATYFQLGRELAFDGTYASSSGLAFVPPGLPLALVPFFWLSGASLVAVMLLNGLAFVATCWLTYELCRRYFGEPGACLAAWLLATWPASILYSWLPVKELVAAPLVLASIHGYLSASEGRGWITKAALSGACVGAGALVHPSLLLFPLIFPLADIVRSGLTRRTVGIFAVQAMFVGLVIAPWTIRNAIALGRFVPISTNGGYNLYVGNNPAASGQFMKIEDFRERFPGDEIERDKLAAAAATRWIKQNPGRFAALAARRIFLYLADDDTGALWAIKRGLGRSDLGYEVARWASNGWWLLVVLLAFCSIGRTRSPVSDIAATAFLYGVAVAAVVFGHSNHHILYVGPLLVLGVAGAAGNAEQRKHWQ